MENFFEILKSIVLGVIQGITEWLPISSTGHMILVDEFLQLKETTPGFKDMFMVVIQFGSILAVILLYFHKLNPFTADKDARQRKSTLLLWVKVLIAVVPAGVIGVLFDDQIHEYLYGPITVASTLILYGIAFLIVEGRNRKSSIQRFSQLNYKTALFIGVFQMLALIPGTSRSGATIVGAVLLGCSREIAAEFSFFLSIPVMFGASCIKMLKTGFSYTGMEWAVLLVGMAVAFLVSVFVIKFLMSFIKKHDFKPFGWYRIALGAVVLIYFVPKLLSAGV